MMVQIVKKKVKKLLVSLPTNSNKTIYHENWHISSL